MEPTIFELIFWCIADAFGLICFVLGMILNPYYDPKSNDPYRYCPKE